MSYLSYISDEKLIDIIKHVLDIGIKRKKEAERKFTNNVIDPFGALFEAGAFGIDHQTWKSSETIRQCQKTLQNHVGELHQKILGSVEGWTDLEKGSVVDLVCEDRKIIAEIKNKYNTVTGSKLADQYRSLEKLIMPKASKYKDYTGYFVCIIPQRAYRFDTLFTPSDNNIGAKCSENDNIRKIDGANFYELVTGETKALENFYYALPNIIENIYKTHYNNKDFLIQNKESFAKYFSLAYQNNHE